MATRKPKRYGLVYLTDRELMVWTHGLRVQLCESQTLLAEKELEERIDLAKREADRRRALRTYPQLQRLTP